LNIIKEWIIPVSAVLLIVIALVTYVAISAHLQWHEQYGAKPGTVEFKTNVGGSGKMAVRDLDNAEQEVQTECNHNWDMIKAIKGMEIKGFDGYPKVTILKKTPW
jgi:hypothetical protein